MRKRFLCAVLSAAMTAALFTGCGAKGSSSTTKTSEIDMAKLSESFKAECIKDVNTTDKIELTVWESSAGPDEFIKKAGEYFTQVFPNITIKYVNVESTDAQSKIALDGPGGNGADLFASAHNTAGVMKSQGTIATVPESEQAYLAANCTEEALRGATLKTAEGESFLVGFPVSVETYALFYNKDLISESEIPKTMTDMVAYIEKWNEDHNDDSEAFLFDAGNAYYSVMFTSSPDNKLYGPEGNDISNTYMNSDQAVKQMEDFVALAKAINMKAGDIDYKHNDALFSAGKLAMDVSGAWNIKQFEEDGVNFGITTIPALTGSESAPTNFMGVRVMYVSEYSQHKTEAMAFAEFLMTKEMQKLRCEITSSMPSRGDVLDTIDKPEVKEYLDGISAQIQTSYPMPNMAQSSLFWTAFASAYSNLWNGEVTDIKKELDEANKTATK